MKEDQNLIHEFKEEKPKASLKINPKVLFSTIILLGIISGFLAARIQTGGGVTSYKQTTDSTTASEFKKGDIVGIKDDKAFRDSAEGDLKLGGIDGEGAYHLERPGGVSQNVYLTSSTVDLSKFVGKKVKVWGETNDAQKAGWLMDVGRLQIL